MAVKIFMHHGISVRKVENVTVASRSFRTRHGKVPEKNQTLSAQDH